MNKRRAYNQGENNPNYGKHHSEETKAKIAASRVNAKNPLWKGDDVGMIGLHRWVRRKMPPPEFCEMCGIRPPKDLANKGIYNRDFKNWEYLCRKCHMISDGRMQRFLEAGRKKLAKIRLSTQLF